MSGTVLLYEMGLNIKPGGKTSLGFMFLILPRPILLVFYISR